jgi:nicotinamide mononucleotide transporter
LRSALSPDTGGRLGIPAILSIALGVGSATRLLPFDWLEAFGFIRGAWGVWLQVRENVWNWPIQLISSALYVVVFLHARLFSDASLNVLYVALYLLGWFWWLRGGENHGELHIARLTPRMALLLAGLAVIATAGWTTFLSSIADSAPFLDAFTTVLSLVALLLTARKIFESWHLWIFVNLVSIGLYIYKGLPLTAVLYAIFAGLSVAGLINWHHLLHRRQEAERPELAHHLSRRRANGYRPDTLAGVHGGVPDLARSRSVRRWHLPVAGSLSLLEGDS